MLIGLLVGALTGWIAQTWFPGAFPILAGLLGVEADPIPLAAIIGFVAGAIHNVIGGGIRFSWKKS